MATKQDALKDYVSSLREKDHLVGFIFDPREDGHEQTRPSKRRKITKKHKVVPETTETQSESLFVPLFGGAETDECVRLRQHLFEESWAQVDGRIQATLREANKATLDEVCSFVKEAAGESAGSIPAAFIVTGSNIASQDLLFEQLGETLQSETKGAFIRLRSGEAPNLKATLKKIIRDVTTKTFEGQDDDFDALIAKDGRKYLDYDLEALHAFVTTTKCPRVIVAFQDSEGFDSGLLSDLIMLFKSWVDRIPFTLVFGIATSVELFQDRLLKSVCRNLHGEQFDVALSSTILARIFKIAVAGADVPLRLGPSLLAALLERQREQVAGIEAFASSLKYTYMCHFYGNPLSILISDDTDRLDSISQAQHLEAVRSLPSFKTYVETAVEEGNLEHARSLLLNDDHLMTLIRSTRTRRDEWASKALRALQFSMALRSQPEEFSDLYIKVLSTGLDSESEYSPFAEAITRLSPDEVLAFLGRARDSMANGDAELQLDGWEEEDSGIAALLADAQGQITALKDKAERAGGVLRSKHMAQSKILRTTVVAQKVQLSRDSAALTKEDGRFTELVDSLARALSDATCCPAASGVPLHEAWLYDSRQPCRDVLVPRPRAVVERALSRPHDYLACSCCAVGANRDNGGDDDAIAPTSPPTAVLYRLYLEAGPLINVADLWSAFYAVVGRGDDEAADERAALHAFYGALAELKWLGFVKATRKKSDHVAKLAWRGL